jgi:hypothetical protein
VARSRPSLGDDVPVEAPSIATAAFIDLFQGPELGLADERARK